MAHAKNPNVDRYNDFQLFSKQLREQISVARRSQGLTQEDMQSAGLSLRQYQRIESGETENMTLLNLYRIAAVLDVDIVTLIHMSNANHK